MNNHKRLKDTRSLVIEIFQEHPDWNARQIYDRYLVLIGDTNKAVTLNAIQKHVEKLKGIYNALDFQALESPWHLGLMGEYHVSPEAAYHIAILQSLLHSQKEPSLTIRQALWASRLFPFMTMWEREKGKGNKKLRSYQRLLQWACAYAEHEIICQLSGVSFDTTELDNGLRRGESVYIGMVYKDGQPVENEKHLGIITISRDGVIKRIKPKKDGEA